MIHWALLTTPIINVFCPHFAECSSSFIRTESMNPNWCDCFKCTRIMRYFLSCEYISFFAVMPTHSVKREAGNEQVNSYITFLPQHTQSHTHTTSKYLQIQVLSFIITFHLRRFM